MAKQQKYEATVEHNLVQPKRTGNWDLLSTHAILSSLSDKYHSKSVVYRTKVLQRQLRFQMYRWITENPSEAYRGTYELNCPPTGVLVRPITRFCNNPIICPWCFVRRRLIPVYEAIRKIPMKEHKGYKTMALRFVVPENSESLFFRRDRGPHQWRDALVTAQTAIPFPCKDDEDLKQKEEDKDSSKLEYVFHIVQVVPIDVDSSVLVADVLRRKTTWSGGQVTELPFTSLTSVIRVLSGAYQMPWLQLFAKRNLQLFSDLKTGFSRQRLLRINPYRYYKKIGVSSEHD